VRAWAKPGSARTSSSRRPCWTRWARRCGCCLPSSAAHPRSRRCRHRWGAFPLPGAHTGFGLLDVWSVQGRCQVQSGGCGYCPPSSPTAISAPSHHYRTSTGPPWCDTTKIAVAMSIRAYPRVWRCPRSHCTPACTARSPPAPLPRSTPPPRPLQVDSDTLRRGGNTNNSQLAACAMLLQQVGFGRLRLPSRMGPSASLPPLPAAGAALAFERLWPAVVCGTPNPHTLPPSLQMFSRTAAAKGADAEYKRAAAVAIGCVMLKVSSARGRGGSV